MEQKRDYLLPASILIAAVMISGSITYLVGSKNRLPSQAANVGDGLNQPSAPVAKIEVASKDVILGDPKAPVTLIEFGDYQCPFCARFFVDTEPKLRDQYIKTGKVKMVFRNFQFLGPESYAAAEAAECAKDQKQFWAFHDAIYDAEYKDGREHNGNLNRDLFMKIASDLKLDTKMFASCFDGKKYEAQIKSDTEAARQFDVNSTPTTFVNGKKVEGAQPFEVFKSLIDAELAS